jgi:putative hydrolase of the HAD superfamily
VRAVLLDALGTLMRLDPPAGPLRRELARRFGVRVDRAAAERAMAAEIAYYRAHSLQGRNRGELALLRRRCAAALRDGLGEQGAGLPLDGVRDALLAALRFTAYPDVHPALRRLRRAGLRLVVVSNWDVSLHDRLAETGIAPLVDGAIASAELGVAKPASGIFSHALTLAGAPPPEAVHVGDSVTEDVEGARAAGIQPILLVRGGEPPPERGGVGTPLRVVRSLAEVAALVA